MKIRIFEIETELPETTDGQTWDRYCVAALTAEGAIKSVKPKLSKHLHEVVRNVRLLATANN